MCALDVFVCGCVQRARPLFSPLVPFLSWCLPLIVHHQPRIPFWLILLVVGQHSFSARLLLD